MSDDYKTCTLPGSTPASLVVSGDRYLALSYDFHYARIWRNLGIIAAQAVVFLVVGVVATNFLHFAPGGTKRVWMRSKRVMKRFRGTWYKRESLDGSSRATTASSRNDLADDSAVFTVADEEGLNHADEDELVGNDDEYGDDVATAQALEMEGSTLSVSTCASLFSSPDGSLIVFIFIVTRSADSGRTYLCGSTLRSKPDGSSIVFRDTSSRDAHAPSLALRELENRLVS